MNLESKICYIGRDALSPSLNLSINEFYFNKVKNGECDAVARIYKHTPGVILSKDQSILDINKNYCNLNSLEIVARPTGGGAVYVSPEHTLCYSIFFNTNILDKLNNSNLDITNAYKQFTELLVKNLKNENINVDLSGAGWYVMANNTSKEKIPIIGHSMHIHKNTYQIDGIVNLKKLPLDHVSSAIHLRKLYSDGEKKYIYSNGKFLENISETNNLNVIRDEYNELDNLIGINDLNLNEEKFIDLLNYSISEFLRGVDYRLDSNDYSNLRKNYDPLGSNKGLGHCFFRYP